MAVAPVPYEAGRRITLTAPTAILDAAGARPYDRLGATRSALPALVPSFIAPLTFLPACCPVMSFRSFVVAAFPEDLDRDVDHM
jgi:hypothetical protein